MKAICVTATRGLDVCDIPDPRDPPPGYVIVRIEAAAINHGDKTFLKRPAAAGPALARTRHDVWGASAAGEVIAAGADVPDGYVGRKVAIYRSLGRGPDTIGLWSELAQVPYTSCLRLPDGADAAEYSGSLVNIVTACAFLDEMAAQGGGGVIATAGGSATGHALAVLARARGVPALLLVRSDKAAAELERHGITDVHRVEGDHGWSAVAHAAEARGITAVFDGVGGGLANRLLPHLPMGVTFYAYGFLSGPELLAFPTSLLVAKNLTIRPFSNFASATVRDPHRLAAALLALEAQVGHPLLQTRVGRRFRLNEIEAAMAFESMPGAKAVLQP